MRINLQIQEKLYKIPQEKRENLGKNYTKFLKKCSYCGILLVRKGINCRKRNGFLYKFNINLTKLTKMKKIGMICNFYVNVFTKSVADK